MSHIVHRNLLKDPPIAVSGQGIWLRDSTGHDVIDGSGGAAVACLGHGHPHVVSAMKAQIDRLCYFLLYTSDAAHDLTRLLVGSRRTLE